MSGDRFQQTKLGWIPEDWKIIDIEDAQISIIDGDRGQHYPKQDEFSDNGYCLFLNASNVTKSGFKFDSCQYVSSDKDKLLRKGRLKRNDLVLTTRGTVGNIAYFDSSIPLDVIRINSGMVILRNENHQFYNRFLYTILGSRLIQNQIKRIAFGSAQPALTVATIKKLKIPLPPLDEQRRIAEILGAWDEAISLTRRLIAAKQRRKQGLIQRLLTGSVRLPGFEGEWGYERAGDLFASISIKNNGDEELLSVTQDQGVLPRAMLDTRVTNPSGSTKSYKLVEPGNFVISLRSFQGGLEFSNYRGLVSPAYTVLKSKKEIVDNFFKYYFKSYVFIGRLAIAVIGIRDGKQISYSDFCTLKLPHPSLDEQRAIAAVLQTADEEIGLLERKLSALRAQKRGLMQVLLSGQVRVNLGKPILRG